MSGSISIITKLLQENCKEETFTSLLAANLTETTLLDKIHACISEAHKIIKVTSARPHLELNATQVNNARETMNTLVFEGIKNQGELNIKKLLLHLTAAIKSQKAGNCYEFAIYTHALLEKKGIKSEIFRISNGAENNHIFLVINRNDALPIDHFYNLGDDALIDDALIVDPYLRKVYIASEIPMLLQSCLYNSESNTVSYIPFDPESHQLDNNLLNETLEDWQKAVETYRKVKFFQNHLQEDSESGKNPETHKNK